MPVGAVFSDLVVDTTDGPVADCPAPPPPTDAGMIDGGTCGGGAATASADAVAASWLPGAFPDATDLNVEADAGNTPTAIAYLRFPPASGSHALLRLHTAAFGSAAGGSGQICRVDDTGWDESAITWTSRPTVSTACTGGEHSVGSDTEVEWDVSALFTSGAPTSFAIVSTDPDGVHYLSREAGGCALGPRLVVDGPVPSDAGTDAATLPTGDAAATDAGASTDASAPMDATAPHDAGGPGGRGLSSGCGCGIAGRPASPLLALLALFAVRRRRRG
jgi:hypothetical protein